MQEIMTAEQKQRAFEILKENPQFSELWMNPKGEFFSNEDYAKNSLKNGEKLENFGGFLEIEDNKELSAKELIAQMEARITIPEVEAILLNEKNSKRRKTVIEVAEKRIEELKQLKEDGKS